MVYKSLGELKKRYYTWEVQGEIRYISSSRGSVEEMLSYWSHVPNSDIKCYYLESANG